MGGMAGTPAGGTGAGTTPGGAAGTPAGGTGGAAGGTGGGPGDEVTIEGVLGGKSDFGNPGWANSFWVTGCDVKQAHDCITNTNTCNSNDGNTSESKGARTVEVFPIGGTPGQKYKVSFRFSAVTEAKFYQGGKRDAGATTPGDVNGGIWDTFHRDGSSPETNYNVLKMTVYDNNMMEARHYYMNSFPNTSFESHRTFLAQYKKAIVVIGGGKIEHFVQDKNCHAIDNCGAGDVQGDTCNAARSMPAPDNTVMLPAMYKDPVDGMVKATPQVASAYANATLAQPWHSQVAKLTVLSIEKTDDPVNMDYPDPP
jgi:hypothetical protein